MIVIDSEFQSLIPPLSEDEYRLLEKSILAEGVREPLITWNGTIIDGHNRYAICDEHGIKFKTVEREFASRDAAKIWIIENQFGRRNLSAYDRSVLALQLEPLYAAEAKRRQVKSGGDRKSQTYQESVSQKSDEPISQLRTDEQLAKLAGTSRDTIRKVKVIEAEAAKGNETAIEARNAVKSGDKSIHKAYTEVRPKADKADTRPICTICGEPIDEGDAYERNQFKHKSCAIVDTETHRGTRGGRYGALNEYNDASRDLQENVATFNVTTLVDELTASVTDMNTAITESITINESMGVTLTGEQKKRIAAAVSALFDAIQSIMGESENGS